MFDNPVFDELAFSGGEGAVAGGASMMSPLIHLIEDDPAVRDSLVWSLRNVDAEVKTYCLPSEILRVEPTAGPSCLVVDFHLPEMDGLLLLTKLREQGWQMPFVVVSGQGDIPAAVHAMHLGAIDFLQKPVDEEVFCKRTQNAIDIDRKRIAVARKHHLFAERLKKLTKRELDVLEGVVAGRLNKQIAVNLGVKVKTVETHRANLTRKLRVESVAQLVQMIVGHRQFIERESNQRQSVDWDSVDRQPIGRESVDGTDLPSLGK